MLKRRVFEKKLEEMTFSPRIEEFFENDDLSEYFFRKIDGTWIEEMK